MSKSQSNVKSGSKTNKLTVGGCQYKFLQGKKKGQICETPCRGEYCFKHKPQRKNCKQEYYNRTKKVNEPHYEKVLRSIKASNIPNVNDYILLQNRSYRSLKLLMKKKLGILLFFDKTSEDVIFYHCDRTFNPHIYKEARLSLYKEAIKNNKIEIEKITHEERKIKSIKDEYNPKIDKIHSILNNLPKNLEDQDKFCKEKEKQIQILINEREDKLKEIYYEFSIRNIIQIIGEDKLLELVKKEYTDEEIVKYEEEFSINYPQFKQPLYIKFSGSKKEAKKFLEDYPKNYEIIVKEIKEYGKIIKLIEDTKEKERHKNLEAITQNKEILIGKNKNVNRPAIEIKPIF
jgi:hypothetical protein